MARRSLFASQHAALAQSQTLDQRLGWLCAYGPTFFSLALLKHEMSQPQQHQNKSIQTTCRRSWLRDSVTSAAVGQFSVDALSVEAQRVGLSLQWLGPTGTQGLHGPGVVPQGGGADLLQAWAGQTFRSSSTEACHAAGLRRNRTLRAYTPVDQCSWSATLDCWTRATATQRERCGRVEHYAAAGEGDDNSRCPERGLAHVLDEEPLACSPCL